MRRLLTTFFYTGLSPVAPGTIGSLAASILLYAVAYLNNPTPLRWQVFLILALLTACALSVWLGEWATTFYGRKDPQVFVLDEVAGICLTNLFLPVGFKSIALAFVAFRIFDVLKPPPCKQLEKLPAGWGILCDDLGAAVYGNLLCHILWRMLF